MADWTIKAGDTNPIFLDTLILPDGSVPALAGATVQFAMRSPSANVAVTGTAAITNPNTGAVQFTPTSADTTTAGNYMASWIVTLAAGGKLTFPTEGYLWVAIEEAVTEGFTPRLVGLPDIKDYCSIDHNDHRHDEKLLWFADAATPLIENIVGPVIVRQFEEWHDGGQTWVSLRRTPSTAIGTNPVLTLVACSEYNGPIEWPLEIVPTPDKGQMYSCMLDARRGRVVRRTAGGGVQPFAIGVDAVHVIYESGQQTVPGNVREAAMEIVRANYWTTQNVGEGAMTLADSPQENAGPPAGFYMPHEALKLLSPNRRYPALA